MKYILSVLLLILSNLGILKAQFPGGGGAGQMNQGEIYGKVIDAKSGKGFDAASIQVTQSKMDSATKKMKEVVIAGQLTKGNGDFRLENLPVFGPLKIKITAIGYEPIVMPLKFDFDPEALKNRDMRALMAAASKDLGNLKLGIKVIQNEAVTVVGEKPQLQLGVDRKIFNVEKNIVSAGGTGADVLRNVPSVQVDLDGNVTLRNAAPQIFVDGRPTPLTIDQIPADAISSVELITNPSAKFDASGGTAGIINIVLKKNKRVGYNGSVRTSIDSRARIGAGGDINVRQEKVNVFASVNYNQRKSISWSETDRLNNFGSTKTSLNQRNNNTSIGAFAFARFGVDYFIDNRNTISITPNFVKGGFDPTETIDIYQTVISTPSFAAKSYRNIKSENQFRNNGLTTGYKHLFTKANHELTADITYNKSKNFNNSDFENAPYINSAALTSLQLVRATGSRETFTFQSDYSRPTGKNGKVEAGVRVNALSVLSENKNFLKNPTDATFKYIDAVSYDFSSEEKVYAAYGTYAQKFNNTNVQLGLRWESSTYDGDLISRNQKFGNKYPNSFFPSVFITRSLGKNQDIQLNYTRKINRPNFFQLIPFIDYADSLNVTRGNPGLVPEFTNNIELSYQLPYRKADNFLFSIYYKKTDNLIARYQTKETILAQELIVNSYINANKSSVYGLELTNRTNVTSYLDIATNINFYGSQLDVPGLPKLSDNFNWFGKINSNLKLAKNITFQVSGDYQGKSFLPPGGNGGGSSFGGGGGGMFGGGGRGGGMFGGQSSNTQGYIKANWGVDIAIRKDLGKERKATISMNINDIFRTKVNWVVSQTDFFFQDAWRRRDPQVFRFNFSYRFGKIDASLFKRKNLKAEGEGMRGAMDGAM